MKVLQIIALGMFFLAQNALATVACDLGLYSQYVGGIGNVADKHPVTQGECTKSFDNGVYVNGWFSESLRDPGLSKTFGNEIDLMIGWSGAIGEKWSADAHTAYYDITNDRLLHGTNGDLADVGGTLKYHISATTSIYSNVESYYGLGSKGFPNGWKAGLGVQTAIMDAANVDVSIYHNGHFFGDGQYLKFSVEPVKAIAKVLGGELRPSLALWKPIGKYDKTYDTQTMVGLRLNW